MVAAPEKGQQTPSAEEKQDKVAVLLTGYGEVESYENFTEYNAEAIRLLTQKFAPIPDWAVPVLSCYLSNADREEWQEENEGFISPHNEIFEQQRAGIETRLQQEWGDRVAVFKAFNFCKPYLPAQVLARIKEQGFNKLLLFPLLVVDSIFTSGIAVEQVNQALKQLADEDKHWVEGFRYIPSFYNRPAYINLVTQMVEERIQRDLAAHHLPSQTGIVLMNHGCPKEAKGFVTGERESQTLYDLVRDKLIDRYPLISVGWLNHETPFVEWTQPNADVAAANLIELGATAIAFMPIGFATENHETILDVETIIEKLKRDRPDITYLRLECTNDHPEFLSMAARWANEKIADLLAENSVDVSPKLARETARNHSDHPWHQHSHE